MGQYSCEGRVRAWSIILGSGSSSPACPSEEGLCFASEGEQTMMCTSCPPPIISSSWSPSGLPPIFPCLLSPDGACDWMQGLHPCMDLWFLPPALMDALMAASSSIRISLYFFVQVTSHGQGQQRCHLQRCSNAFAIAKLHPTGQAWAGCRHKSSRHQISPALLPRQVSPSSPAACTAPCLMSVKRHISQSAGRPN